MKAHTDELRLDLPADNKYLNVVGACLEAFIERIDHLEDAHSTAYNIQLAVNEIFANIVVHAYEGMVGQRIGMTIRLIPGPRRLLVELADTGNPFDPSLVPEPNLEDVQIHGYGLFLARNLMDDVSYTRHPDGNTWQLIKHL